MPNIQVVVEGEIPVTFTRSVTVLEEELAEFLIRMDDRGELLKILAADEILMSPGSDYGMHCADDSDCYIGYAVELEDPFFWEYIDCHTPNYYKHKHKNKAGDRYA